MEIEKGRVFNDLPALKRWLQAFTVLHKRPYKVLHSYVERRYTRAVDGGVRDDQRNRAP
jgi:hypothetical protein